MANRWATHISYLFFLMMSWSASAYRVQSKAETLQALQKMLMSNSTDFGGHSLMQSNQSSESIMAVLGLTMAMVSIVTTIWDLWEKWNAIIMLQFAFKEMGKSPWNKVQRYKKYDSLSFCLRDRVDDSIETMSTVEVYFKLLFYAAFECARPDVHINWLDHQQRCTRDYAAERIDELYGEVCSARFGRGIFGTVDMLLESGNTTSDPHCRCLPDHTCGGKSWCRVAKDSKCPDVESDLFGYYSHTPCFTENMHNPDKARRLLKSTCTVCNHGFFNNAGVIQTAFSEGKYGAANVIDITHNTQRQALKERLQIALTDDYKVDVDQLLEAQISTGKPKDEDKEEHEDASPSKVAERAFVAILNWEQMTAFDQRCTAFKNTLSVNERTQMTGEDLVNEKVNRLMIDGRLGQIGASFQHGLEIAFSPVQKIVDKTKSAWHKFRHKDEEPQGKEVGDEIDVQDDDDEDEEQHDGRETKAKDSASASSFAEIGSSTKARSTQLQDVWNILGDGDSELNYCSDMKLLQDHPSKVAELASGGQAELEEACKTVDGARFRWGTWLFGKREHGPQCKCKKKTHQVYCGSEQVADRRFAIREVLVNPQCTTKSQPYCDDHVRTEKEELHKRVHSLGCRALPGAVPRQWSLYPHCKCAKEDHKVFCNHRQVADRKFNVVTVVEEADCLLPYCAPADHGEESSESEAASLMQMKSEQTRALAGRGLPIWNALVWLPIQMGRVFKASASAVVDHTLAMWWFAFNNVYGTIGTVEAFQILEKTTVLSEKFMQWTGIVTFFIWLIDDAIFAGMNQGMCPRITEWIGMMEDARQSAKDREKKEAAEIEGDSSLTEATSDSSDTSKMQCRQKVTKVKDDMYDEVKNMAATAKRLEAIRGGDESQAKEWSNLLEFDLNNADETMDILQVNKKANSLFAKELDPSVLCPIADMVLDRDFQKDKTIDKASRKKVKRAACKCDPVPAFC